MEARNEPRPSTPPRPAWIPLGWGIALLVAVGVRLWNGVRGPLLRGYDDHGHVGYVLYLDLYRAVPWADQGWSYFHPPLHYVFGWALAQLRDVDALLHGLALLGGASSLLIAYMAARVTRLADPARRDLPLFAFASVALLPVYLYSSTMAGNELTAALFGTLGFAVLIGNEQRSRPRLTADALAGLALGLALLSKVSAVLVLGACGLTLLLRLLRERPLVRSAPRTLSRGVVLAGVACAVASPYYARNVAEFGTPVVMSRENPHVVKLESTQPPGHRSLRDFFSLPPALLLDPDPQAEHALHSVWGTAYAGMWADTRMADNAHEERTRAARSTAVILGLAPTLLALLGAALALSDLLRGKRCALYAPVFCVAATSLAAFAYFAVAAPQFSALKASYLLGLTLPYAVFLARGIEAMDRLGRTRAVGLACAIVAVPGAASALVNASGVVVPQRADHKAVASLAYYFEQHGEARALYRKERASLFPSASLFVDLASVSLAEGDPFAARQLLALAARGRQKDPLVWNAFGVATALCGELETALDLLDRAVEKGGGEVVLVNRGVVRAALGSLDAAEADFRAALLADDALAPAWHGLAELLAQVGPEAEASGAREHARVAASRAPRGHPYGIPDGLGQYPSPALGIRFMLWPASARAGDEGRTLRLARAPFRAADAIAMRAPEEIFAGTPDIALIVIDTLRADHLGAYGYPRPTSPVFDRLAREGVLFTNVSAASSWTLPSVASLFTSRTPAEHRAEAWGRKLQARHTTFVERLRLAGYHTVGVSGNFVHVNEKVGFDRGFDAWETLSVEVEDPDEEPLLLVERGTLPLRAPSAGEVNAAVLRSLPEAPSRPLFLYVHYMEPHSEYDPPAPQRRAFTGGRPPPAGLETVTSEYLGKLARGEREIGPEEKQRVIDLYDAEIASVDAAIGELLSALEERGFGDDLIVAIVSDHGEEFGEHDGWFHGLTLHAESLTVPLVLWDGRAARRGEAVGRVIDAPVDLLDVPTTLLAAAGVERPKKMHGRDLLPDGPRHGRDLVAALGRDKLLERHVRPRTHRLATTRWPWKIIASRDGAARIYQLERDPGEQAPLAPADRDVPPEIARIAAEMILSGRPAPNGDAESPAPPPEAAPSAAELEQLRALGYAE